jgi:hypothetical protein
VCPCRLQQPIYATATVLGRHVNVLTVSEP